MCKCNLVNVKLKNVRGKYANNLILDKLFSRKKTCKF